MTERGLCRNEDITEVLTTSLNCGDVFTVIKAACDSVSYIMRLFVLGVSACLDATGYVIILNLYYLFLLLYVKKC